jgi:hypothetical protein
LGFVHHSRTLFCRAVPNRNLTIRIFCIAAAAAQVRAVQLPGRGSRVKEAAVADLMELAEVRIPRLLCSHVRHSFTVGGGAFNYHINCFLCF